MPTITRDRIRLELHLDRDGSLIDKLTDATPLLWRGTDTQFELAVFFDGVLMDPSTLSSLRLQVKPADNRTGTALMDKTITTFNAALTQANWDNETDQHCVVAFLNSETNFVIGADSKDYWLVVTALTTDVPARKVTLGTSTITVVESGATDGSTPPAGDPLYYTGAQSDARYVLKLGDTMTGLLQWSGTTHAGLKLNNLTTAQRDALTPAAGNLIYNTTDGRPQFRDGSAWTEFAKRSGDTFTGAVTVTALTIGALAGVLKATAGAVSGSATTSDLPEGTNLYYTQARFDTAFAAKTTTNLAEGSNLYFTNARVDSRITSTWRGLANGLASLDSGGKIPTGELPPLAITEVFVVASQAAMLALTAQRGDVAIRTDINKNFILSTDDPTVLANWKELLVPPDAVLSVNGQTGNVVLTTTNINEGTNLYYTDARARAAVGVTQPYVLNGILHATSTTAIGTSGNLRWDGSIFTVTGSNQVASFIGTNPHVRVSQTGGTVESIVGVGASTTFLGSFTNHQLDFLVNNAAKWSITTEGILQSPSAQTLQTLTGTLTIQGNGGQTNIGGNVFLARSQGANRYLSLDNDNTNTGKLVVQAGGGSDSYGGSVVAFGHAHGARPGWITANVSTGSGGKFAVTGGGLGDAAAVFTVDTGGNTVITGNVGIGTMAPAGKLHSIDATFYNQTAGSAGGVGVFQSSYTALNSIISTFIASNAATDVQLNIFPAALNVAGIQARKYTAAGTINLALQPDGGNVGIGTTAPSTPLHIVTPVANDGNPQLLLSRNNGSYGLQVTAYSNILFKTKLSDNITWQTFLRIGEGLTSDSAHLLLQPEAGRVGIGTISPSYDLSFGGNSDRSVGMEKSTSGTPPSFTLRAADSADGTNNWASDLIIQTGTGTGNSSGATTGRIILRISPPVASGVTRQTLVDGIIIAQSGVVNLPSLTASKFVKTDASKNLISGDVDWADITNKPSTFTPSAHTHSAADVTSGLLALARGGTNTDLSVASNFELLYMSSGTFARVAVNSTTTPKFLRMTGTGSAGVAPAFQQVDWADLANKPSTFTPSAHTHNAADVVGGTLAMGTDSWILLQGSASTVGLFTSRVSGDANYRLLMACSGQFEWGDGAAARDCFLWRVAAGVLRIDDWLRIDGLTPSKFVKTDANKTLISGDVDWADIINKPSTFTPASHTHDTADITSGILGSARGGTGNGFTAFSGPSGVAKTFTLPNASANIVTADAGTGTGTISTTDSTPADLYTFTIPDQTAILVRAHVVARRSDYAAAAAYVLFACFRRSGSTVTQVGTTQQQVVLEDASEAALDATIDASTTTIRVRVTGRTTTTLAWRGLISVTQAP